MSNFKYVEKIGYINVDNIMYISDVFQRCDTWNFNIHFIDGSTMPVSTGSKSISGGIVLNLIKK